MQIEKVDPNLWRINGIEIEANDEQDALKRYAGRLEGEVKSLTVERNHLRNDNERLTKLLDKKKLSPQEALEKMRALKKWHKDDPEAFHCEADDLLCVLLKGCGYDLTVQEFKRRQK